MLTHGYSGRVTQDVLYVLLHHPTAQVELAMARKHHVGAAVAPQRCCLALLARL